MRRRLVLLTAATLALVPCLTASGSLLPTKIAITDVGGGVSMWSYDLGIDGSTVALAEDSPAPGGSAASGARSYFTVYDFADYVPDSCAAPVGWKCSAEDIGLTPMGTAPKDDPHVTNLTWSYLDGNPLRGNVVLTGFSAASAIQVAGTAAFAAMADNADGLPAVGTGAVAAPAASVSTPNIPDNSSGNPPADSDPGITTAATNDPAGTGLPEPGNFGLLGAALLALSLVQRRRVVTAMATRRST